MNVLALGQAAPASLANKKTPFPAKTTMPRGRHRSSRWLARTVRRRA